MAEKQNSAFRLYRFIQKMVPQHPPNQPTAQVLLRAFGVEKNVSQREQNAILPRIEVLLLDELNSLVTDLRRAGHSEESIQPIIKPFDSIAGTGLATQWSAYSPVFAASLPVLLMVAENLPEDSTAVGPEELSELNASVEKLRTEVQNSTLSEKVKRFVFEQLDFITRAIRDYPLAGANAFKSAVREAVFHVSEHPEVVEALAKDTPVLSSLKQIQGTAVKFAKYAIELSKFVGALDSLYHHLFQHLLK
jgi:hypothetical protein